MSWPPGAQRVLLVLAALLIALGAGAFGGSPQRRSGAVPIPDDPALEVRLDLNRASAADLETLPGIGPALAARIVARRERRGPFRAVDELAEVPGIGEKLLATLRPLLTCAPDPTPSP